MGKNFKNNLNPAIQFISAASDGPVIQIPAAAATGIQKTASGHKRAPISYTETKSRRLQLLIKPSTYDKLAAKAAAERISVNEMINILIDKQV